MTITTQTPSFAQLLDWIEGRLSEQDAAMIATQVAQADDETRATVGWLRNFYSLSTGIFLNAPPLSIRQEVLRRVKQWRAERQKPGLFRRFIASLSFDSGWSLATAGVRAVNGLGNQRQIVCSTEVADVVINTQPAKGGSQLDVMGQVLLTHEDIDNSANATSDFVVQLLNNDIEVRMTQADDIGEFTFEAIEPGVYEFVVSSGQLEIQTPSIELKLA